MDTSGVANKTTSINLVGFWSAALATIFSITYVTGQLAEWSGLLGSKGGPESESTPIGLVILLTPSLLLGPCFVVLMACIHHMAAPDKKLWSHIALVFATAYAILTGLVYFVQLSFVAPRIVRGETQGIEILIFEPFNSFLYAIDIFGYSFMSLATLFAAVVFNKNGLERTIRLFLFANGFLLPFIALQMFFHPLIYVASLWAITFPGSTLCLAFLFLRYSDHPMLTNPEN